MITPADYDLTVQRHAAFPSLDPFLLREKLTGVPVNITGAIVVIEVRLHDKAAETLLSQTMSVISGPGGTFAPPSFSEMDHEGLPPSNLHDPKPLSGAVRFRYAIKATGIPNMPSSLIIQRGYYIVEDGAAF